MNDVDLFYKNIIIEARDFAKIKHGEQKYGEHDYVYHLDNVYKIAQEFNLEFKYLIAAYLHDVLEDTITTKEELKEKFGIWISEVVWAVSGFGDGRKARKADMLAKIEVFQDAILLKMIDRLANMREASKNGEAKLLQMYVDEIKDYDHLFSKGNKDIYYEIKLFKDSELLVKKAKNKM